MIDNPSQTEDQELSAIELMARALYPQAFVKKHKTRSSARARTKGRKIARRMLASIREPTRAMFLAALAHKKRSEVWRAMIDKALEE